MLEGFVKIPILKGNSFMSVTENGLHFSGKAVFNMQKANYVQFFLNESTKQIAIQKCNKNSEDAISFFRSEKNLKNGVHFNNSEILQMICDMMEWNLEEFNFRIEGIFIEESQAMTFDLNNAKKSKKKKRKKANQEQETF